MPPPVFPLARRTAHGIVVDERLVRVACRWIDLPSRDGERVEVEWAAQVGCVDTPADREVLAERLLGGDDATLEVAAIARLLADEIRPTLARLVATSEVATLLDGSRDAEHAAAIEAQARRAGFAAGLRVAGPFTLRVDSPSVRRAQESARARAALDALGDRAADPLDELRAVASADARSRDATPTLWIAVGDQLIGVDPTRPELSASPIAIDGMGPIRSVRGVTVEGHEALLVGGRDGVAIVDRDGRMIRACPMTGGGEVGFNAACVLPGTGDVLATHSQHGLARWRGARGSAEPLGKVGGGKAIVPLREDAAAVVLASDGRLWIARGNSIAPLNDGGAAIVDLAALPDGRLVIADAERYVAILEVDGTSIARMRVASPITGIAAIDLCGVPRMLVSHEDGTIALVDVESGVTTPLGDGRWPAKVMRARPGFAALLSVDRMRVGLLDLSRPDAAIVELHVYAKLGRRAADVWFA